MATATPSANRRSFLASAAAIGSVAAAGVTIPALAAPAPSDNTAAWDRAFSAYQKASAEYRAYGPEFDRIHEAWRTSRPSMDGIKWDDFGSPRLQQAARDEVVRMWDLDREYQRFCAGEGKWWFGPDAAKRKAEYRAALDSVQAYRDADEAHRRTSGMDAADDRIDELCTADADAECELMNMPAPHRAALRWKLDRIFEPDGETLETMPAWSGDFIRQTIADYQRLLGGEA